MKIVILTQYYPPEHGAPQNRLHDLACRAVMFGHEVTVLTALPNYPSGQVFPGYRGRFSVAEDIDGVKVLRSWIFASRNKGLVLQLVEYFSFVFSSLAVGVLRLSRADYLICESPPLFLGLTALVLKYLKSARLVMNISDLWPESAVQLGMLGPGLKLSLLERFERVLYSKSAVVTCQTEGIERGVKKSCPGARTQLYPNGVDLDMFKSARKSASLANEIGVSSGKFIVGYGGNHGRSQALLQVLHAAEIVSGQNPDVLFLLFGDGPEKDELVSKAKEMKLDNLLFMPSQKRHDMMKVQGLWDIALVPLKDIELFKGARPSKMFELMAGEIPFVFCGTGEGAQIAENSGCAVSVPPEQPEKLAEKILWLAKMPAGKLKAMGCSGRKFVQENFDRAKLAKQLLDVLSGMLGEKLSDAEEEGYGTGKASKGKARGISWFLSTMAAGCGVIAIALWQAAAPDFAISRNVPGLDFHGSMSRGATAHEVVIGEFFSSSEGIQTTPSAYSWPRFRGSNFDNICLAPPPLPLGSADLPPPVAWKIELGEGHAAPAVHNGRVYILDYDEKEKADALRCLSLDTGMEIWRRWYSNPLKRNHGISRTIPAVSDEYVLTVGPACHVMCVKADSGELLWTVDMVEQYGTTVPLWYTGQCPLIDGDTAVIAPAGDDVLMAGIHCVTGETLWQTENIPGVKMSHSSIIPMTLAGKRTYVYAAQGAIVGVSAEGSDTGRLLWSCTEWNRKVVAPSPVHLGDDRLLITAGYGGGSMVLRITQAGSNFSCEVLQTVRPSQGLASEQQTPIFSSGKLYTVMPKDAGVLRMQFVCASPDDITDILWSSGSENRFGLGPFMLADNKFFILDDSGTMTVLDATQEHLPQMARFKLLEGHDAWGPIALAGNRMLLRDSTTMICLEFPPE